VLEIAIELGFNSRSTFYKAFKRETGLTPSAYRAQPPSTVR
jgi:AraC-like DNA-binding protein